MKRKNKVKILNFFAYLATLFLCLLILGNNYLDAGTIHHILSILYNVFRILLLISIVLVTASTMIMVFTNTEKTNVKKKYCDYCGKRVVSGNKYHHTCLMKKYEGTVIKQ